LPGSEFRQRNVIGGDRRCYSIAAASIVAKVTRDRLMCELDGSYPSYGFAGHKGYGTPPHLQALRRHGPCPVHRLSFAPCRECSQLGLFATDASDEG
jgi:ribonuclease HII